jgi:hypothetical protein
LKSSEIRLVCRKRRHYLASLTVMSTSTNELILLEATSVQKRARRYVARKQKKRKRENRRDIGSEEYQTAK